MGLGHPPAGSGPPDPAGSGDQSMAELRHDLINPINQILGYSELLEEDARDRYPDAVEDLGKIQQAAGTLLSLLQTRLVGALESPAGPNQLLVNQLLPSTPLPDQESGGAAPRTGQILVVDDDAANLELLALRLQRQGHGVTSASDGEEALERLRHHAFDLLLLDVMMPRLDGYGTLERLKIHPQWRHLPVIMISALDELSSVVRCIEAGADDYLAKPFNPTLLRARIGACLDKKASRDQEIALYNTLVRSQQRLRADVDAARSQVESLAPELREDARVSPVLAALARMAGAVSLRENDLRVTLQELEIKINRQALTTQVSSIVSDPAFSALSERARAMRSRRRPQGGD